MTRLFLILITLSLGLMGCGDGGGSNDRTRINPYRGAQQYNGANPITQPGSVPGFNQSPNFQSTWGEITANAQQPQGFQAAVYGFVSSTADPYTLIGSVSGNSGSSTGLRFAGKVQTQNAQPVAGNLNILIFDSFAAQGSSGAKVIPLNFQGGQVMMQNQFQGTASLVFSDSAGTVHLDGTFTAYNNGNDVFQGTVTYKNNRYWDGQTPGHQDILGNFRVSTCGFFTCN